MLYAENKNRHVASSNYYKAFKELFPFESNIIDLLKSKNYTEFSVLLQQIEARILLKNICKRIHQKDHSIPLFTIHDGIITTNCKSGPPEIIDNGKGGFLVPLKSPVALSNKIKFVINNDKVAKSKSQHAKKRINRFLCEKNSYIYLNFLKKVLNDR